MYLDHEGNRKGDISPTSSVERGIIRRLISILISPGTGCGTSLDWITLEPSERTPNLQWNLVYKALYRFRFAETNQVLGSNHD